MASCIGAALIHSPVAWLGGIFYVVGVVFGILIYIGICQARNRPGWWAILLIIPLVNLVFLGILAFSKK